MTENQFKETAAKLPRKVSRAILFLDEKTQEEICEIRLAADCNTVIVFPQKSLYLYAFGGVGETLSDDCVTVSKEELNECFFSLCNRSVYAHSKEISQGFVSVGFGCRAGICGRFSENGAVDVTSINLRLSHDVKNCADGIIGFAKNGLLIAGPPASGKTTLLRDAARSLSNGLTGRKVRVCVVDSREEITVGFDMGNFCDSLIVKDKSKGIEMALRTMSPEIIAFDEIGSSEELCGVFDSLNAGVGIITTAHAGGINELKNRVVIRKLLESGAVSHIALLSGKIGEKPEIIKTEEIL